MGNARKHRLIRERLCKKTSGALAGTSMSTKFFSCSKAGTPCGNSKTDSAEYCSVPKYFVLAEGILACIPARHVPESARLPQQGDDSVSEFVRGCGTPNIRRQMLL